MPFTAEEAEDYFADGFVGVQGYFLGPAFDACFSEVAEGLRPVQCNIKRLTSNFFLPVVEMYFTAEVAEDFLNEVLLVCIYI